jgi:hypothetical protein
MRKALKLATLMGLTAALVLPTASMAEDVGMEEQTITIKGQLRERIEYWKIDNSYRPVGNYRARIQIKAKLADGVTAVFTPQAVGYWGENLQGVLLGESASTYDEEPAYLAKADRGVSGTTNTLNLHEAYILLNNAFGVDGLIVKLGRQEVNLGNQRLVGSVGWSQAARSIDGVLAAYKAGDFGTAIAFYGKLNESVNRFDAWTIPNTDTGDIDLYVASWQGALKPFGIGGTYEATAIFVDGMEHSTIDNINTFYFRGTPVVDLGSMKVKANAEVAFQNGQDQNGNDYKGYFFSVGGGATFADVAAKPSVFVGYDYYSGDDGKDNDIDAFWSVLPTAHKWLGFADQIWVGNFYKFNGAFPTATDEGITDLYVKFSAKPLAKVATLAHFHYFQTAEDVANPSNPNETSKDVGMELDLQAKYKYSKNLCLTLGYEWFDPDTAYEYKTDSSGTVHHLWLQADLKF